MLDEMIEGGGGAVVVRWRCSSSGGGLEVRWRCSLLIIAAGNREKKPIKKEVQSVVKPIKKEVKRAPIKKNSLKNLNTMLRLNTYAKTSKRMTVLDEEQRKKARQQKLDSKRKPISKMLSI